MSKARILICPLDWGLGHAVRCVPIIRAIIKQGAVPVIGADNGALILLKKEFPNAEFVKFPGVTISYPSEGESMLWSMLKQTPALLSGIKNEKIFIEKAVQELDIDAVISDNRFGAYSKNVPSIYITHQINIQTGNKLTDALAKKQHAKYMQKFNTVWIPDIEENEGISGKLSHGKDIPKHAKYIGLLTRFDTLTETEKKYDVSFILSGPEPQRTMLEDIILRQISSFEKKRFLLIRGKNEMLSNQPKNITVIGMVESKEIQEIYASSEHIVCRSGYSSIMEMATVNRSAWLIPTPEQTEQEYLAEYLDDKFEFKSIPQKYFNLNLLFSHDIPKSAMKFQNQIDNKLDYLITELLRSVSNKKG